MMILYIEALSQPRLKLVYDTYHLRMEEKSALSTILDDYWR